MKSNQNISFLLPVPDIFFEKTADSLMTNQWNLTLKCGRSSSCQQRQCIYIKTFPELQEQTQEIFDFPNTTKWKYPKKTFNKG